ncbi:Dabb family protein [Pseudomonas citronellolis]|uniref:Dabb family protein n=1 Tax=Pseudomonas citronellolis TaxID=53408 RepID=UPI00248DDDC0|nr:Dabb family protein [Pseudomonas citronellolis]
MSVHCVVVSWLKEPGNLEHIAQLTAACESLRQIPGVNEVRFGPRANLGGVGSDDSFDFAMIISFESFKAAQDYGPHPNHVQAAQLTVQLAERFQSFYFET